MKARKRYLLVCIAFLAFIYFGLILWRPKMLLNEISVMNSLSSKRDSNHSVFRSSYYHWNTFSVYDNKRVINKSNNSYKMCRMNTCFDFSKCIPGSLKVHIYPNSMSTVSGSYAKILNFIKNSRFYESDPNKACLFVTTYDTLDRDPLSPDYQKHLPNAIPIENGKNHLVFNLYSGTWPHYHELDFSSFSIGYAILVKASQSFNNYRPGFDVSLPLFAKNHPEKGPTFISHESIQSNVPTISDSSSIASHTSGRKNLLVFKGKRYIYGIGSETRNSLHHLHNGKDILIYTTCKHGKRWKDLRDERCESDNREYDKYDYQSLMTNSTFCLVPRGRRLGSFRFLEALSFGCIPVVLSNSWVLPYSEVIDWSSAVISADERLLLQIPEQIRSIPQQKLASMRSRCISLYENYFSSVERIVLTALTIIEERIERHLSRDTFMWNVVNPGYTGFTGAIWFDPRFSDQIADFPGYSSHLNRTFTNSSQSGYTAVIYVGKPIIITSFIKLVKNTLVGSQYLKKILIIWSISASVPSQLKTRKSLSLINIIEPQVNSPNAKLYPYSIISTDAVFQLDPDTTLTTEELDFAYLVWQSFSDRIIGFTARDYYYDESKDQWSYTSKWTNQYSIVLLDAAIYHKYYNYLYTHHISSIYESELDGECADLGLVFLISHITREAPIKLTQRKKTIANASNTWSVWNSRRTCFAQLIQWFGYMPLIKSQMRFDPVLFKDAVSNTRKKYRKLELMT